MKKRPRRRPHARPETTSETKTETGERLQKVLAAAGFGSRRQCEEFIEAGRVTVDGEVVSTLGARVDPAQQVVCFDGERVKAERHVYWWINKPPGVLCTVRDTHGRPTVLQLLPPMKEHLFPVGRLDEESTGLLLLTNDGPLANLLTHPRYGVSKTYEVLVAGKVTNDVMMKLKKGTWFADGPARVHAIQRIGSRGDATFLRIVLREGHNREIRRLFARFEHKVMRLERVAIGPIKIRKLKKGESRRATATEIEMLRKIGHQAEQRSDGSEEHESS